MLHDYNSTRTRAHGIHGTDESGNDNGRDVIHVTETWYVWRAFVIRRDRTVINDFIIIIRVPRRRV